LVLYAQHEAAIVAPHFDGPWPLVGTHALASDVDRNPSRVEEPYQE
jgi:hypothetical protein